MLSGSVDACRRNTIWFTATWRRVSELLSLHAWESVPPIVPPQRPERCDEHPEDHRGPHLQASTIFHYSLLRSCKKPLHKSLRVCTLSAMTQGKFPSRNSWHLPCSEKEEAYPRAMIKPNAFRFV